MERVTSGYSILRHRDRAGLLNIWHVDGESPVNQFVNDIESRLDCLATVDRAVSVENFLEDLNIGNQPIAGTNRVSQQATGIFLTHKTGTDLFLGVGPKLTIQAARLRGNSATLFGSEMSAR